MTACRIRDASEQYAKRREDIFHVYLHIEPYGRYRDRRCHGSWCDRPRVGRSGFVQRGSLRSAVPSDITDVRYRGGYYHDNGAGVALGVLGVVGAVAAASAYRHHPYGYGYYGNPGYYQQGYAYGPRYYGNGPGYYGDHRRGW